jgi:hypothetical protein
MKSFKLVVLSNPVAGREDEYNEWYTNKHLADVVAVSGFRCAQRFKLRNPMGFEHGHRYLAIYEIESDQPQAVVEEMLKRSGTPSMVLSDSLDMTTVTCGLFESCSPLVERQVGTVGVADQSRVA